VGVGYTNTCCCVTDRDKNILLTTFPVLYAVFTMNVTERVVL